MTDLENARAILAQGNYTCVLCKGERTIIDSRPGIAPMLALIAEGRDLAGFSAADRVIGRAAALLFALAGVRAVHARVMSEGAAQTLDAHNIARGCDELVKNIINRAGTGICPMEQAVSAIDDPGAAYRALREKARELKAQATDAPGA